LNLQVASVDIGGLHSSLWVPVLLGFFYAVLGLLHIGLDGLAVQQGTTSTGFAPLESLQRFLSNPGNAETTQACNSRQSWPLLACNTGVLASLLFLSAVLFDQNVPYGVIGGVLAAGGIVNWKIFDGTKQGFILGVLCAFAAPVSELVIINVFGLWEYARPDVFGPGGLPSWVPLCYFFYTPAVGNLARLLVSPRT
jgi:heat shock protein 5